MHAYSFTGNFSLKVMLIFLFKDLNALRDDLMELKPTLLAGVPRVFEKIHEGREFCFSSILIEKTPKIS